MTCLNKLDLSLYFFLTIYFELFNFTKILGQNVERSNKNHKSFHIHHCCVCCCFSLSETVTVRPFGTNFKGNILHHHVQAKYKHGRKSLDTLYSSSLDFIKPQTEPPSCYVYLLSQCRRCIKRGLNFCICDGN